ncbi:hypothetical protein D3C84_1233440 [compost metagenome]
MAPTISTDRYVSNWLRAISTSRITPASFKNSSVIGPAMAGPHAATNSGDTSLAHRLWMAMLAGAAKYTAPRPPHAKAST